MKETTIGKMVKKEFKVKPNIIAGKRAFDIKFERDGTKYTLRYHKGTLPTNLEWIKCDIQYMLNLVKK